MRRERAVALPDRQDDPSNPSNPSNPSRLGRSSRPKKGGPEVACEALGRSRGGLTTKLHLVTDGRGRPLGLCLSEGQRHDSKLLEAVLDRVRVPRKRGRPRKRPDLLCLDKGYSYPRCRQLLRRRGIRHVIPERKDQREGRRRKGSRGGRPPRFEGWAYALRSWVERGINRLKQWRGIATRYAKRAANYQALATIVSIKLWIEH